MPTEIEKLLIYKFVQFSERNNLWNLVIIIRFGINVILSISATEEFISSFV